MWVGLERNKSLDPFRKRFAISPWSKIRAAGVWAEAGARRGGRSQRTDYIELSAIWRWCRDNADTNRIPDKLKRDTDQAKAMSEAGACAGACAGAGVGVRRRRPRPTTYQILEIILCSGQQPYRPSTLHCCWFNN